MTREELSDLIAAAGIKHPCLPYSEEGQNKGGAFLHSVCSDEEPGSFREDKEHECLLDVLGSTREQAAARAKLIAYALNEILKRGRGKESND